MSQRIKKEANIFDKILKEQLEFVFLPLIEKELGSKIKSRKILKHKLQSTIEREVDYLFDVTLADKRNFILHIEFQTKPERDLIYRIKEYNAILSRTYKKKIEHMVVYLGMPKFNSPVSLKNSEVFQSFRLLNLSETDQEIFLNSNNPSDLLISILCKIPEEHTDHFFSYLINKAIELLPNPAEINKFASNLLNFTRLRNFNSSTINKIKHMPITYDIDKDILFKLGKEKGREEGREVGREEGREEGREVGREEGETKVQINIIRNFLKNNYTLKEISVIMGLSIQKITSIIKKNNLK